ncbi:uncharacterized protein Dwil_GK27000 [Drosophila willistoni]|nr:uncharacterized protein Dwil_GK27000 [Drosophila willistoni]
MRQLHWQLQLVPHRSNNSNNIFRLYPLPMRINNISSLSASNYHHHQLRSRSPSSSNPQQQPQQLQLQLQLQPPLITQNPQINGGQGQFPSQSHEQPQPQRGRRNSAPATMPHAIICTASHQVTDV